MQDFTKLRVWHDSQDLAVSVFAATRAFPREERFGLSSQMRRAAVSVSSNIAEGCGRFGPVEVSRFLQIGISSACELVSQIELSHRLHFVDNQIASSLATQAEAVRKSLIRLEAKVRGGGSKSGR
jgi:four helix bundle protein